MSWQESKISEEKLMFINDWLKQEFTHAALCDRYQISRPTGYELINGTKMKAWLPLKSDLEHRLIYLIKPLRPLRPNCWH
jgi:hypothetical protein